MARRFIKKVVLGTLGAASLAGLLSGGISRADANCAECDLLTVRQVAPESATLGRVSVGNLRDGINIASIFHRPRDFDRQVESPMAQMLDLRRNPYLANAQQPTGQAFLFAPWGASAARPQNAASPAVLFSTRVQPFWNMSQGYSQFGTAPWATMTFDVPQFPGFSPAPNTPGAFPAL